MMQRLIPSTKEAIPVIGLGTWKTFDVAAENELTNLTNVLAAFHDAGGRLIDTSPMYGRSEETIGELTSASVLKDDFFYATKVWTQGKNEGIDQMEASIRKMKRSTIDLMQIHNLVDWEIHLETLKEWKAAGKIRYIGITHYLDAAHDDLVKVLETQAIDFVQFNYSILHRNAEKRLLPAALDLGVATLINRPFGEGKMFAQVQGKSLPQWAVAQGMHDWSEFFLQYILAHPAVTCIIPATANPQHAAQNIRVAKNDLPDKVTLTKMMAFADGL
jgi:diketogulonate reductase-like aldo/keto reductase